MEHWETTSILSTRRPLPFFRQGDSFHSSTSTEKPFEQCGLFWSPSVSVVELELWGYLIYLRRKCRSSALGDWAKVGIVEKLFIYPVKSMKGIEVILTLTTTVQVDQMDCTQIGPCNGDVKDRHFMVMDVDSGKLITGRQLPLLVTFTAHIEVTIASSFWCWCRRFTAWFNRSPQQKFNCSNFTGTDHRSESNSSSRVYSLFLRLTFFPSKDIIEAN